MDVVQCDLNGSLSLKPCSRGTDNPTVLTSGRRAGPRVNPESWRMAQILSLDLSLPWLEAFSLRAGSRAEERGLAIDWFSSLALACIPRFRRLRSSHWLKGQAGHSSIFFKSLPMSCCLCRGLSQLRTMYPPGPPACMTLLNKAGKAAFKYNISWNCCSICCFFN